MSVRVLAIGDPHFRVDNLQEVEVFIEHIRTLVDNTQLDFVVCMGDLLHTHERLHTIALNKAYDFVKSISKPLYILVGNHDYIQNQQFLTTNHWMNGLKEWPNVTIVDSVIVRHYNNQKFVFCPYVPNGRFDEALATIDDGISDATCIFAHQEFQGCKMGAIISIDGDKWPVDAPFVLSGHIHAKQRPQPNIYYCGSAMQHAFGESEEATVSVVEFISAADRKISEIDTGLPKKKIIYTTLDKDIDLSKLDSHVKVTLSGNASDFKTFKKTAEYKKLLDTGAKVVFKALPFELANAVPAHSAKDDRIDFKQILHDITCDDASLSEMYNLIVNKSDVIVISS